jgi:hypothetical protein
METFVTLDGRSGPSCSKVDTKTAAPIRRELTSPRERAEGRKADDPSNVLV